MKDKALKSICLKTPESLEQYFRLLQCILPHVSENATVDVCIAMSESYRVDPKDEIALLNYFRTMKLISNRVKIPEQVSL